MPHQCSPESLASWTKVFMLSLDGLRLCGKCKSTMPDRSAQKPMVTSFAQGLTAILRSKIRDSDSLEWPEHTPLPFPAAELGLCNVTPLPPSVSSFCTILLNYRVIKKNSWPFGGKCNEALCGSSATKKQWLSPIFLLFPSNSLRLC